MKYIYYSFITLFFTSFFFVSFYNRTEGGAREYVADQEILSEKYAGIYEELHWLEKTDSSEEVLSMIAFLDAVATGKYLDYLSLYMHERKEARLQYEDFNALHQKMQLLADSSIFTEEELLETLSYSLILSAVKECDEYQKRTWVYDASSVHEVVSLYSQILPTLTRFSHQQTRLLCTLLEGLEFEGYLEKYRNNISYDTDESLSFLKENVDCFDLSFVLFICRMAGQYSRKGQDNPKLTSGFYSYLMGFREDLLTHLQLSS